MKKINIILYILLKRLHAFIGSLILKIKVEDVFNLKYIEKRIELFYRTPGYNKNKTRKKRFVLSRHVLRTVLRNNTNMSLDEIALYTQSISHATIINSHKAVDDMIKTDLIFNKEFMKLMKSMNLKYREYNTNSELYVN